MIPGRVIPYGFAPVLSGHIHRRQLLTTNLRDRAFAAPVFCPGSAARTSAAERNEAKGSVTMEIAPGGRVAAWTFHELSPTAEKIAPAGPHIVRPFLRLTRDVTRGHRAAQRRFSFLGKLRFQTWPFSNFSGTCFRDGDHSPTEPKREHDRP